MTKNSNDNEHEFISFEPNQNTKIRFEDADEDEVAEGSGVAGEEVAQDESMFDAGESADTADVTDDTTSADYYFDSYSHFGKFPFFKFNFVLFGYEYLQIFDFGSICFAGIHEVSIEDKAQLFL